LSGRVPPVKNFFRKVLKKVLTEPGKYDSISSKRDRKEGTKMKYTMNYTETTMDALIEEALAEMEKNGETLPEIRYGEEG
jgi:hypothetical protein